MFTHLTAVWKFRYFLGALVRLDLRLRYRRSVFGIGWSLLNPIAMTCVFCLVFSTLLGENNWKDYSCFLLTGLAVWGFLRDAALSGCRTFIQNETYLRQSSLPYSIYPLRTVLGQAIHFAIALAVAMALITLVNLDARAFTVFGAVLPGLVMALLAAWAVATLAAFANVYFQDTQHLAEVAAQIMFFVTPIMYKPVVLHNKNLTWLVNINPVNVFMDLIRDPLMTGVAPSFADYLHGAGLTAALVGLAVGTMAWLQKKVIFHL
jgi:ABC-type polysaccharide/polyol phosphate export permease